MNHLPAILNAYQNSQGKDQALFLATVVKTQGSTYRRPGARMLVTSTGEITGMVSGGCLEHDIFHHTQQQQSDDPFIITYDTKAEEDLIWGFGLGCDGAVHILIERLDLSRRLNPIEFLADCLDNLQWGVLATLIGVEGLVNLKVGAHLSLDLEGNAISEIDNIDLEQAIISDARNTLDRQKSTLRQYQLPSGSAEVFLEVIQPPTPLIIFGAGQDAVPLANLAKTLGWYVTVVDCRAQSATRDRFAMADRTILTRRNLISQAVDVHAQTVAVVITHNYFDDLEILKMLLSSSARYIGVLGARRRTERLLQELDETFQIAKPLHAPVGLDIGAETPEEIALAILAEIQAVVSGRHGGFLRGRTGSIHQPYESAPGIYSR